MPGFDDETFPRLLTADGLADWQLEEFASYIRSMTKVVRNALRREKRLWTEEQCGALGDHVYARQTREAFQLLKKLAKHKGYISKGALAMADGTITRDKSALHAMWTAHWTEHFGSSIEKGHSFDNFELPGYDQPFSLVPSLHAALDAPACGFTTAHEVRSIMSTFNVNRSAPDICPLRYWRMLEPWLSGALAQEYNACLQMGRIPNSWSGSLLVPICKRSKSPYVPESHRPIQLMLSEAKVFSRLLLHSITSCLAMSWRQYAQGAGAAAALTICHQVTALAQSENQSVALIFLDVAAAFDEVSHQLLFGASSDQEDSDTDIIDGAPVIHASLRSLSDLSWEAARDVQLYVKEYPHHVLTGALPPCMAKLVQQWVQSPWMKLRLMSDQAEEHTSDAMKISRGIRQGDCLSGYLFCAFFDVLLRQLHQYIVDTTDIVDFGQAGGNTTEALISLLAYADDVLMPMMNACPSRLVVQMRRLMCFTKKLFAKYKLRINLGKSKTEACMQLRSAKARPIMQYLRGQADEQHTTAPERKGRNSCVSRALCLERTA
eukprot:4180316-Amphidinium_carterae.1